jgi:hypothetical protein
MEIYRYRPGTFNARTFRFRRKALIKSLNGEADMVIAQIPKMVGFIYALVLFVFAAYLWHTGRWTRTIWYVLLIVTTGFGFLILSPLIPYQFQLLVLGQTGALGAPLVVAIIGIIVILVLSFLFGRHYCGYLCPVGAVQ